MKEHSWRNNPYVSVKKISQWMRLEEKTIEKYCDEHKLGMIVSGKRAIDQLEYGKIREGLQAMGLWKDLPMRRGPIMIMRQGMMGRRVNKTVSLDIETIKIIERYCDNNASGYIENLVWEDGERIGKP